MTNVWIRLGFSPFIHVEWWPEHEAHGHILQIGDGINRVLDVDTEEWASELGDAVIQCHREDGTYCHTAQDAKEAMSQALLQLQTIDYDAAYDELQRRIKAFRKWGMKQAPAAVLMPTQEDYKRWVAIVPDRQGEIHAYPLRKGVLEDIIPYPEKHLAVPDPHGVGFLAKPRWSLPRRLRRTLKQRGVSNVDS